MEDHDQADRDAVAGHRRARTDGAFASAYAELCRIARGCCGRTSRGDELDAATLVHEAYLRVKRRRGGTGCTEPAGVFVRTMALLMRTVARDLRRRRWAVKRGRALLRPWPEVEPPNPEGGARLAELLALRLAFEQLKRHDPRWHAAMVQHDLCGYSVHETAAFLGVTDEEIRSYRRAGLRWLRRVLSSSPTPLPLHSPQVSRNRQRHPKRR